jgi:hypothetical protein
MPSCWFNPRREQMGSTIFGDAIVADPARPVSPRQFETNRGIVGRVRDRD